MKTILTTLVMILSIAVFSQEADSLKIKGKKDKTLKEITIKTTSQCGMCKERIEEEMAFEKGVKFVELDVKTKLLTIKYKENKTTVEKLKNAVAAIGYDADEIPANPEAYSKLPKCCQKGGHDHH